MRSIQEETPPDMAVRGVRSIVALAAVLCLCLASSLLRMSPAFAVADPTGNYDVVTFYNGSNVYGTWSIDTFDPATGQFSGTGDGGTFALSGALTGSEITVTVVGANGYTVNDTATVQSDGSMSGTFHDSTGVGGTWSASRQGPVGYKFDAVAMYQSGAPADLCCGAPAGAPETGFVTIMNNGSSTFIGTIGFNGAGAQPGTVSYGPLTLNPGDHSSFSFDPESSDAGGFTWPPGTTPETGVQFFMNGTVDNGTSSETVDLAIYDQDIHSNTFTTNPFGVTLDNFILQGGDSLGRDTGDAYELSQAPGPFEFFQAATSPESSIAGSGAPLTEREGATFSATVATFTDPDAGATAQDYAATINWGDGSSTDTGSISGGTGSFSVAGTHSYAEEGSYAVQVTITDVDTPGNSVTVNSTATVKDADLASACGNPPVSSTWFSGGIANLTDANPNARPSDYSATIAWGDGSPSSAGTVSGSPGGPFSVSGSHSYSTTGPKSISVTVNDVGGSTSSLTCSVLIYSSASSTGGFVIGDGNSLNGTPVTFWSAQWSALNSLSGGPAPTSFKGFAVNPAAPACGTVWTTDGGNSSFLPAAPLPAYMSVIVTSGSSQSGNQITGNTVHMVVVRTNPGYAPSVGQAGTGTVVAQIC
jgi:hypothetical protein